MLNFYCKILIYSYLLISLYIFFDFVFLCGKDFKKYAIFGTSKK